MKTKLLLLSFCLAAGNAIHAQTNTFPSAGSAGIGTLLPAASSALEIKSTSQGLLIPRMTKLQRDGIGSPATGLMIYQTNSAPGFYYFNGTIWTPVSVSGANAYLSNLKLPTAVNNDLLPDTNNTVNLGSAGLKWQTLYASRADIVSGTQNVFGGFYAGEVNTGTDNTGFGYKALSLNKSGSNNAAFGEGSLINNLSGNLNSASGASALALNTTGNANTAMGAFSGYGNSKGYGNATFGSYAGFLGSTANHVTAIGDSSLVHNTVSENVAMGYKALFNNTTGQANTASGSTALAANTTGGNNTAMGYASMFFNTTGDYNSGYGENTLYANTTGDFNTAVGVFALADNTTGYNNTAIGMQSLNFTSTGRQNTGLGYNTGSGNVTGSNLTLVGYNANVFSANLSNSTALGNWAFVDGSNQVRIGNSSVTSIGGYTGWTNISDGRVKKNIRQNIPGLLFINKLQPVSYNLDLNAIDVILHPDGDSTAQANDAVTARREKEKIVYSGFIAQDVEKAAKESGFDFSGVDKPSNPNGAWGLRYAEFVVPLVKAVQELSTQNEQLANQGNAKNELIQKQQEEINKLSAQMNMVLQKLDELQSAQQECCTKTNATQINKTQDEMVYAVASLQQNAPNPFTSNTVIKYYLPATTKTAQLTITDCKGTTLKTIALSNKGNAQVTLSAGSLTAGNYFYSLIVDGKRTDTKQMQIMH